MIRTLPALKLRNSPLVIVLVQVRISPVMKMGEYIPDIQENLRRAGLPRFLTGEDVQVQVAQGQPASVHRAPRWEFQNRDLTQSVVVGQDFVSVQTTAYDVYETFAELFKVPFQIVGDIVEPSLVQRIGLRYVDLIRPEPGHGVLEFLKPSLRGLDADEIGAEQILSRFEMLATTSVGKMRIRCLQSNDGSCLPPDLKGSAHLNLSKTMAKDVQPREIVTFLDFDHYSVISRDYEVSSLVESIGHLHANLGQAFQSAVTDHALYEVWGAERNSQG